MADKKISELTALSGANTASNDVLAIVDTSAVETKKITVDELQKAPVSSGTANGVAYLNGSKALTTGSALTFDGTNLSTGTIGIAGATAPVGADNERIKISNLYDSTIQAIYYGAAAVTQKYLNVGWNLLTYGSGGSGFMINGVSGIFRPSTNTSLVIAGDYHVFGSLSANGFANASPTFTEYMRLTSTGLGIGTSSPGAKLHVAGNVYISEGNSIAAYSVPYSGVTSRITMSSYTGTETTLQFSTMNSSGVLGEKMRIDGSGNLGLGVTPSGWGSQFRAMQLGPASDQSNFIAGYNGAAIMSMGSGAFFNGTNWIYPGSVAAAVFYADQGKFIWNIAPSGTAGNPISFTQAMTLDASGRLGVGTTTINAQMVIGGVGGYSVGGNRNTLQLRNSNSSGNQSNFFVFGSAGTESSCWIGNDLAANGTEVNVLSFGTNDTERARIDASGNFIHQVNGTAPTLATNSTMSFELTSNTSLKVVVRGTDGVTRSVSLTLA